MEAGKRKISDVLSRGTILKVPFFQRSYVWNTNQWERFLEDMDYVSRSNSPYFMGSVIFKQIETATHEIERDVREIVDGQQRLTTLLLFFKVLFLKNGVPDDFKTNFHSYHGNLILQHNFIDKPLFEKILKDKINDMDEMDEKTKEKRIYKCYKYFLDNIQENSLSHNNLLSNIMFVGIDLQSKEDEQQIFDTINSLGVSLTTAELLKNYLFNEDIDSYNKNWKEIFEAEDDIISYWGKEINAGRVKRTNIDLFLQSYLSIKIQETPLNVTSEDKERFFKVESVFNSYKEFITNYKINKDELILKLKDYAQVYKNTFNPNISQEFVDRDSNVDRLNLLIFGLETTTLIPYILYITKNVKDETERNRIFKYLEAYLMRRLICRTNNKNYNQLFNGSMINREINTLDKLIEFIEDKSEKINFMPSDVEVAKGFAESTLSNKLSKGILYLIELTTRNNFNATQLKNFKDYSVEHVLPKKWRNNWDSTFLSEEDKRERDRILYTLGNLTLITSNLNSSIRDADWSTKKSGVGTNKGLMEYAQGVEIFSKYLQRESWSESDIRERANELYENAIKVWNLDV